MEEKQFTKTGKIMKEQKNEEYTWAAVSLLLIISSLEHEIKWVQFANELIHKNRFLPDTKILDMVKQKSEQATKIINKGQKLFRARIYDTNHKKIMNIVKQTKHLNKEEKEKIIKCFKSPIKPQESIEAAISLMSKENIIKSFDSPRNEESFEAVISLLSGAHMLGNKEQVSEYFKNIEHSEDTLFKGYGKDDSTAPPMGNITEGRANPSCIRYLYVAEKSKTAIYEVRPIIKQQVSVSSIEVKDNLKIYDLTISTEEENSSESNLNKKSLLEVIGAAFAEPNHGNKEFYIPTQYIAEYIKKLGFDGIRFRSSLHKGGINILVFEPEKCEAVSSDLYEIEDVDIKIKTI